MRIAIWLVVVGTVGCASIPPIASPGATDSHGTFTLGAESRNYDLFRPANMPLVEARRSLVVMLHGCSQTADDLARGSRMTSASSQEGFAVLYVEQPATANALRCWNWYLPEHTTRDRGEAALLSALIDSVARVEGVSSEHIALVGMSAGAAMAAALMTAYPERYGALVTHSGVAALAAKDMGGALRAMRGDVNGDTLGRAAVAVMGSRLRAVPVLILHGRDDKVVAPANATALVKQWVAVNAAAGARAPVETRLFDGVGHAWSGGSTDGSYTAPTGPDATAIIVEFLRRNGVLTVR